MMLSQIIFIEARDESDLPPIFKLTFIDEKFAVRMPVLLSFILLTLSVLSVFVAVLSVGFTVRQDEKISTMEIIRRKILFFILFGFLPAKVEKNLVCGKILHFFIKIVRQLAARGGGICIISHCATLV